MAREGDRWRGAQQEIADGQLRQRRFDVVSTECFVQDPSELFSAETWADVELIAAKGDLNATKDKLDAKQNRCEAATLIGSATSMRSLRTRCHVSNVCLVCPVTGAGTQTSPTELVGL
jgi:hypothetical protein